jgi:hypothetical protein
LTQAFNYLPRPIRFFISESSNIMVYGENMEEKKDLGKSTLTDPMGQKPYI